MTAQARLAVDRLDDLELARLCAARDEPALRHVITANNQRLFRAAWSILKNRWDAEEAVQAAYLKAFAVSLVRAIGWNSWLGVSVLVLAGWFVTARAGFRLDRRAGILFAALVLGVLASGCARVKPWEREYLTVRPMTPGIERAEDRFRQHWQFAREGSDGGFGAAGGGCGCN